MIELTKEELLIIINGISMRYPNCDYKDYNLPDFLIKELDLAELLKHKIRGYYESK
jgi:hypothetical protein